jgi:hypothetical protein
VRLVFTGLGPTGKPDATEPWQRPPVYEEPNPTEGSDEQRQDEGRQFADSKRGQARGSGGTMKNQNPGKQDNNKAQNTKSNKQ